MLLHWKTAGLSYSLMHKAAGRKLKVWQHVDIQYKSKSSSLMLLLYKQYNRLFFCVYSICDLAPPTQTVPQLDRDRTVARSSCNWQLWGVVTHLDPVLLWSITAVMEYSFSNLITRVELPLNIHKTTKPCFNTWLQRISHFRKTWILHTNQTWQLRLKVNKN